MALTRQTFLTRARQMSDTLFGAVEYPDELLKDLAAMVHVDEWRRLLDEAPYYRTALRTVTLSGTGSFPWSDLSSGTGNSRETVYRVLQIADAAGNDLTYAQPERVRIAVQPALDAAHKLWTRVGSTVQTFGVAGTVSVLVNWTPCSIGDLASDADTIDFPDPYAPILFYETAALALEKGGRETGEAQALKASAEAMRQKMLASLKRESAQAWVIGPDDSAWEWGVGG